MNTKLRSWRDLTEHELRSLLGLLMVNDWKPSQQAKDDLSQFQIANGLYNTPLAYQLELYIDDRCQNSEEGLDGNVKTKYGTFKFSAHSIDRIRERTGFNHLFFGKHLDKFEISHARSTNTTFKHGYTVYLRCKILNIVLVVSPSLGILHVVTAYKYSESKLRKLDWFSLKNFQGWDSLS